MIWVLIRFISGLLTRHKVHETSGGEGQPQSHQNRYLTRTATLMCGNDSWCAYQLGLNSLGLIRETITTIKIDWLGQFYEESLARRPLNP